MSIKSANINPFAYQYASLPVINNNEKKTNIFTNKIQTSNFFDNSINTTKPNSLYLKDDILAKCLPNSFIAKYLNSGFINKQIQNNPKIQEILNAKGLAVNANLHNVLEIINSHLIPTYTYAKLIMKESGINFSPEDYTIMEQASLLHDIGKIFIPAEILNKKENLTQKEREIIGLHDILGVELLKNTQLNPKVLTLIDSHHKCDGINDNSILTQILKIADIYSALKENRSYKMSMNEEDTFKVLFEKW